jgi:hypothetical protein
MVRSLTKEKWAGHHKTGVTGAPSNAKLPHVAVGAELAKSHFIQLKMSRFQTVGPPGCPNRKSDKIRESYYEQMSGMCHLGDVKPSFPAANAATAP